MTAAHGGLEAACCAQVGGTFWLTRLARDREAAVRVAALSLLAHLASARAAPTRRMLLQGWPEAGTAVLKVSRQPLTMCVLNLLLYAQFALRRQSRGQHLVTVPGAGHMSHGAFMCYHLDLQELLTWFDALQHELSPSKFLLPESKHTVLLAVSHCHN